MNNNDFKIPLLQSGAILGGIIIIFGIIASSGSSSSEGGFLGFLGAIGSIILFGIGMVIALAVCISLLVAIFLAAVGMVAPDQAKTMYADLKKNFAKIAVASSSNLAKGQMRIAEEEYEQMNQEISTLQNTSSLLQQKVNGLQDRNSDLDARLGTLSQENSSLKEQLSDLSLSIEQLQQAEAEIKSQMEKLQEAINAKDNSQQDELVKQLAAAQDDIQKQLEALNTRLNNLESESKQSPVSGIFSYIGSEEHRNLFSEKVEEAIKQELTYAQIDEFLTENLPPDLDEVIKAHPALTRNYIRNLRRD